MPRLRQTVLAALFTIMMGATHMVTAYALTGTTWVLVELDGADVKPVDGQRPTISFETGRMNGNGGCNRFSAAFTMRVKKAHPDYGTINVGPILSTRMYCKATSQREAQLFKSLRTAVRYHRPANKPDNLTLYDEQAAVLMRLRRSSAQR